MLFPYIKILIIKPIEPNDDNKIMQGQKIREKVREKKEKSKGRREKEMARVEF